MNVSVSTNYRELLPDEVATVAAELASAWQDPEIPRRQYERAVKDELEGWRSGRPCAPFDALVKCLLEIPEQFWPSVSPWRTLLDVGASGGYYSEVLRIAGFDVRYRGIDFSQAFADLAGYLYYGVPFDVGDARALPYPDGEYDIVLHGACIMHLPLDYGKAIAEAARVSSKYVLFHRTPITNGSETKCYEKQGYDCRMIEIHFNETVLFDLFEQNNLTVLHTEDVFWNEGEGFGHRDYLLRKES